MYLLKEYKKSIMKEGSSRVKFPTGIRRSHDKEPIG